MIKFLDEFSFIKMIIEMINKCIQKNKKSEIIENDEETI